MREIPVISRADREHAQPVQRHADRDRLPGDAGPDRGEAAEVHSDEGQGGRIHDVVMRVGVSVGIVWLIGHGNAYSAPWGMFGRLPSALLTGMPDG